MESLEFIHHVNYGDGAVDHQMRLEEDECVFLDKVVANFLQFLDGMGFVNRVDVIIHKPDRKPEVYSNRKSVTKD